MASQNTKDLNEKLRTLRSGTVKIILAAEPGDNRAARRRAQRGWRLRSKMSTERWNQVFEWKYPKEKKQKMDEPEEVTIGHKFIGTLKKTAKLLTLPKKTFARQKV